MIRHLSLTLFLCFAVSAPAHESEPQVDVPKSAKAAATTVDRFFSALSAGDLEAAGALLDPQVIILESGGAEHSAAEYLGGHAKGDAEFLKGAQHVLTRRMARTEGQLAWVASEETRRVVAGWSAAAVTLGRAAYDAMPARRSPST